MVTIAEELAKKHKEISVAEFFEKNRHLLGFDSKPKAMLTCVKEAVDNAIDACEEYNFNRIKRNLPIEWPEVLVKIERLERVQAIFLNDEEIGELVNTGKDVYLVRAGKKIRASKRGENYVLYKVDGYKIEVRNGKVKVNGEDASLKELVTKYKISVTDNGPGIVKDQIPKVFGKLLYGSKFHRLRQSRGQQGIGISAVILYSKLTTGLPAKITSRIGKGRPAYTVEMSINTIKNEPEIFKVYEDSFPFDHGTRIEVVIDATYISKGEKSVYEFLRRTSLVNPHVTITFIDPNGQKFVFKRTAQRFPKEPKEIKPHPHGIELGVLERMLKTTKHKDLKSFLVNEFSSLGEKVAEEILQRLKLENKKPKELTLKEIESLLKALHKAKIRRPPLDCLSPIGADELKRKLEAEFKPEFVHAVTRKPTVYRGMPFVVEAAIAYGGEIKAPTLMRFANKIPLLYDASACAITKAVQEIDWRRYNVETQGNTPAGPYLILVHIASVWVPYTSEGKTAIGSYPVILKEIKLALQDVARKIAVHLARKQREITRAKKKQVFVNYSYEVAHALSQILKEREEKILKMLQEIVEKRLSAGVAESE